METLFLLVRLLLAGVLAAAGAAKLVDLAGSRQAMRDFGLPISLAAPLGLLLPLAEIGVALALVPAVSAWAGAIAALLLLLLFIGGILVNLVHGNRPNCHCFGQLHSQPIGRATLIRNGVLALLAALIVVQGPKGVGPGLLGWMGDFTLTSYLILAGCVVVVALMVGQSWVVLNLLRQNGRLLLRLEALEKHLGLADSTTEMAQAKTAPQGLAVGTPAPAFQLSALDGTEQSLATLLALGKPLLLIFSSASCGPCIELMGEVAQWQQSYAKQLTIAVINRGAVEAVRAKMDATNPTYMLVQKESEIAAAYLVTGTPSAVLIGTDGTIRTALAGGAAAVRELVAAASQPLAMVADRLLRRAPIQLEAGQPTPTPRPLAPALPTGMAAPAFQLPNLNGQRVELAQLRGTATLLLFWNPACGFCRRMLGDLQAWEAQPHTNAPRLVLISTGSVEVNQAQGLSAPTLLDDNFGTGYAYGAKGTPSAVLIDAHGKIASPLVVGASAIMPLLVGDATTTTDLMAQPLAA
jgi:peroxiredoxin